MMPKKFCDDISNGSGVMVLTDKQTDKQSPPQTDTAQNNTTRATLHCAGGKHSLLSVVGLNIYLGSIYDTMSLTVWIRTGY